jgi:hypothetical protein
MFVKTATHNFNKYKNILFFKQMPESISICHWEAMNYFSQIADHNSKNQK